MFNEEREDASNIVMARPSLLGTLLFGPFAIALLCYIWAFCSQSHKLPDFREFLCLSCKRRTRELRGTQNIYYPAFVLLVFDGLTLIFGLAWGILLFCDSVEVASVICFNVWFAMRVLSVCQHLITALVSVIFAYHPKWGSGLRTVSKVLNMVPFILIILVYRVDDNILIGVDVYNILVMIAIVVSCCLPATSSTAQQRKCIGLLAVSLFFFICLPNMVLSCMSVSNEELYPLAVDVLLFTNFYIVLDGLLFLLVLKLEEGDQSDTQYECAIRSA